MFQFNLGRGYLFPSLGAIFLLFWACLGTHAETDQVDGQRVIDHVEKIVSFGPHPPGSEAIEKVREYIATQLKEARLEVRQDRFEAVTPIGRLEMVNIWGVLPGDTSDVVIIASHYDSKLFKEFQFVGANDGGSSTGLVLELAKILAPQNPIQQTIWFVFFDGEEALEEWTAADSLYGSRRFVKMLGRRNQMGRIKAMILLDMVGGRDLTLRRDINSTAWLSNLIWEKARELGHGDIFSTLGSTGAVDDHIPFAEQRVPVVDIIDLGYMYWHRSEDTVDKLSAENLEIVGNVVLASLPEISERLE